MKTINLRDFYPTLYRNDSFYDVPDEVAELLILYKRREESQKRLARKYKAYYSIDNDDGIEIHITNLVSSAEAIFIKHLEKTVLSAALQRLTVKQMRRLYSYFFLDMSYIQIARREKVNESTIRRSIQAALVQLEKIIDFF